jgi:hypothetical protein
MECLKTFSCNTILWVFYDKYGIRGAFKEAKERKYGTFIIGVLMISGTFFI